MHRFFIEVSDGAFETLSDLAIRQRRAVRDQAACVLEVALASTDAPALHPDDVEVSPAPPLEAVA